MPYCWPRQQHNAAPLHFNKPQPHGLLTTFAAELPFVLLHAGATTARLAWPLAAYLLLLPLLLRHRTATARSTCFRHLLPPCSDFN